MEMRLFSAMDTAKYAKKYHFWHILSKLSIYAAVARNGPLDIKNDFFLFKKKLLQDLFLQPHLLDTGVALPVIARLNGLLVPISADPFKQH